MRNAGQDNSSLDTEKQGCAKAPGHSPPDLSQETEPPNCMQFTCTKYSPQTPEARWAAWCPDSSALPHCPSGNAPSRTRPERRGWHRGTMATHGPGPWQHTARGLRNRSGAADARSRLAPIETQPKSWSIMLDFAGITPSAILVTKWRGNRCSRLSGPIFPRTLCQHRYIWKLNDYHPRQRKRAL